MTGETQGQGDPEELRRLFDASPDLDSELDGEIEDYLLAHDAMVGTEPGPEQVERVRRVAEGLANLSPDELDEVVEDARRNSPLAHYFREVLPGMIESPDTSPVPFHRSNHASNPAGLSQDEWDKLPESTKRLLRRRDDS
jgi:hypothetical protein